MTVSRPAAIPGMPLQNTVPIGTMANLPAVIDALGGDGWSFMQDFGLGPDTFLRPMQPLPVQVCGELLHRAVLRTGCDALPLLLGVRARMENIGPLRLLVASSARVRDALDALLRFRKIWYSGFRLALTEECGIASMTVDLSGHFVGHQLLRTTFLTAMARHMEAIVGPQWQLREVQLSRQQPADGSPYRKHFGFTPAFGQVRDALHFESRLLELNRPVPDQAELHAFLRTQLTTMEAALGISFSAQVSELIETMVMAGHCSIDSVAEILGMHRLTLYRRLRREGCTFEALLDERRRLMAQDMLLHKSMTILDTAEALGYSSPTNFSRAFRRWHGCPPSAWLAASRP